MAGFLLWMAAVFASPEPSALPLHLAASFEQAQYERVLVYSYDHLEHPILDEKGRLDRSAKLPPKELTSDQAGTLAAILKERASHEGDPGRCFHPHHGFVFLDARNRVVAHVSLCFDCNNLRATPAIEAERSSAGHGFSESARRRLQSLCTELGVGHCGYEG